MIKKIALVAASMTASLVLAGGLALAGFGAPAPAADMQAVDQVVANPSDATPADLTTPAQGDTIEVAPQPVPVETPTPDIKEAKHHAETESGESGEREDD